MHETIYRSLTSKEDEHQFQKHGASFHNCLQAHEPSCTLCKGQPLQYSVVNTQIEDSVVQYALSTGTNVL